jgi:hypothetical protein
MENSHMSNINSTNGERLASIETILVRMEPKLDDLVKEVAADKADLAELKNRGTGILIGVALAAGSAGAAVLKGWQAITG